MITHAQSHTHIDHVFPSILLVIYMVISECNVSFSCFIILCLITADLQIYVGYIKKRKRQSEWILQNLRGGLIWRRTCFKVTHHISSSVTILIMTNHTQPKVKIIEMFGVFCGHSIALAFPTTLKTHSKYNNTIVKAEFEFGQNKIIKTSQFCPNSSMLSVRVVGLCAASTALLLQGSLLFVLDITAASREQASEGPPCKLQSNHSWGVSWPLTHWSLFRRCSFSPSPFLSLFCFFLPGWIQKVLMSP